LLLTPAFYVVCRRLALLRQPSTRGIDAQESTAPPISTSPESEVRP
jgi:hypothetical protein